MGSMNSEIKITKELRPCWIVGNGLMAKGLFHQWNEDGNAIVELEDGRCSTYSSFNIKFVQSKCNEYNFE